jgi:type IV pilus assembly protein PilB
VAAPKRIGELLIEANVLTAEQLEQALKVQRNDGRKLGHLLIELGLVSETVLTQALSRQLAVPWVSLFHVDFSRSLLNLITREVAERYALVPIFVRRVRKQGDTLYVAMDDPTNEAALAEVSKTAGIPVRPMIACPSDIRSAIRVYYLGGEATPGTAPLAPPVPPPPAKRETRPDLPPLAPPPRASSPEVAPPSSAAEPEAEGDRVSDPPPSDDSPDASPEIQATELSPRSVRAKRGPRMVALTLLDGTTITLPAAKKRRASRPDVDEAPRSESSPGEVSDQLTARDLISALRAVSHGADASEILGTSPPGWEAMFATLLSLLLKKGLIADWEFVEEFRKI